MVVLRRVAGALAVPIAIGAVTGCTALFPFDAQSADAGSGDAGDPADAADSVDAAGLRDAGSPGDAGSCDASSRCGDAGPRPCIRSSDCDDDDVCTLDLCTDSHCAHELAGMPVYRYNQGNQHRWSVLESEPAPWKPEGEAFRTMAQGRSGMVELLQFSDGWDYVVSTNPEEPAAAGLGRDASLGFVWEEAPAGAMALFRLVNDELGLHFVTLNGAEGINEGYAHETTLGYTCRFWLE